MGDLLRGTHLPAAALAVACSMFACGEGDDGSQVVVPEPAELAVDRGSIDFGSITLGEASPRATVIVANAGGSASGVPSVKLSGAGFTIASTTCTKPVDARRNCVIAVAFRPTESGPASGTLTISTAGSSYDTVFAVYSGPATGATLANISNFGCIDDVPGSSQAAFTGPVTPGSIIYVQVGGYAAATGDLVISVS